MEQKEKIIEVNNEVIAAIKSGKAKMRPKWRFALRTILTATAGVIVVLILVYLASFVVFALHENGAWFAPVFGLGGWYVFFNALPLVIILLSALFIGILAVLIRQYPEGYHWPVIYSLFGILFLIVGGGFVITQTPLSGELFREGMKEEIPLVGGFYGGFGVTDLYNVHRGTIVASTTNGFIMHELHGEISAVVVDASTSLPYGDSFRIGDAVVVFGVHIGDSVIRAAGIERLSAAQ